MNVVRIARRLARPVLTHAPALGRLLIDAATAAKAWEHAAAARVPALIRPRTRSLTVAITARCNLRCAGCRYGRDFMAGEQLPLELVRTMLDDAAEAGVETVRLYGGEPLLHPDLPAMVAHGVERGLGVYVTTNGSLLARRIDALYAAGLRTLTLGFYGVDDAYDAYCARRGAFARFEQGIATVRERYGDTVRLRLNWLLMRPTANDAALDAALAFARRYRVGIQVDLIHYSLPYFTEGVDGELQFRPEDRAAVEHIAGRLLDAKRREPWLIEHSEIGLRSIPEWLMRGAQMRVPCDKYEMLWIGADGSVQLCYVTFHLGNLHEVRLRDLLFTPEHAAAARDAFRLACPNCHCGYDSRTQKHLASRRRFGSRAARTVG